MKKKIWLLLLAVTLLAGSVLAAGAAKPEDAGTIGIESEKEDLENKAQCLNELSIESIKESEWESGTETESEMQKTAESETEMKTEAKTEEEVSFETDRKEIVQEEEVIVEPGQQKDTVKAENNQTQENTGEKKETSAAKPVTRAAAVEYIQYHNSGSLLTHNLERDYNNTNASRNACILNGAPERADYTQFKSSLAAVKQDPFDGMQGVNISKSRADYKKGSLMTATYSNKLYYYNGRSYAYGDIRMTVVDYYKDNLGNGDAYFAFSPNRPGIFTYGLEWVEVKYEFFASGTTTPVNVSGYVVYKDLDLNQGLVFTEGNVTGGYGYKNSQIKKTKAGNYTYYYSTNAENLATENTAGWLGINFDGTYFNTVYTFCKKNSNGNQAKSSGAIGMNYTGVYISDNEEGRNLKKYAGSTKETLSESSNEVTRYGQQYWYRLMLYVPPRISDSYSSVSILDGIPSWLKIVSCNSAKNGSGTEVMGNYWNYSVNGNTITYTAVKLNDESFYDRSYYFDICVEVRDEKSFKEIQAPAYDNAVGKYYWTNWAVVEFNGASSDSNHVTTYMPHLKPSPWIWLEKIDKETGRAVTSGDAEFEILERQADGGYRHYDTMQWDVSSGYYKSSKKMQWTNENQGVFKIKEIVPPGGYILNSEWNQEFDLDDYLVSQETLAFEKENACWNDLNSVTIYKLSQKAYGETVQKPIKGVKFRIEGAEGCRIDKMTDSDGKIVLNGLKPGSYTFYELSTADGYVLERAQYHFRIEKNGDCVNESMEIIMSGTYGKRVFTVLNAPVQLAVQKRDRRTGNVLSGAEMRLETETGVLVREFISGNQPEYFARLKKGNYVLKEVKAPAGYIISEPMNFTVKEVSGVQNIYMYDLPYTTVNVTKRIKMDEVIWAHGKPVFVFTLTGTDAEGEKHTFHGSVEFTEKSVKNAGFYEETLSFEHVPAGNYSLSEKGALGYYLAEVSSEDFNVNISKLSEPGYGLEPSEIFSVKINTLQKLSSSVIFTNRKQTCDDYRHSARVVNQISISALK